MYTIIINQKSGFKRSESIERGELTVGRAMVNDIILPEATVSRNHAVFIVEGETLVLRDLDSLHGTFCNHEKVTKDTILTHGDIIDIGNTRLTVEKEQSRKTEESAVDFAEDEETRLYNAEELQELLSQHADDGKKSEEAVAAGTGASKNEDRFDGTVVLAKGSEFHKDMKSTEILYRLVSALPGDDMNFIDLGSGETVIERSLLQELGLPSSSVSRRHALIDCNRSGVFVEDLNSSNGTTVNGENLSERKKLSPGDQVCFGDEAFILKNVPQQSAQQKRRRFLLIVLLVMLCLAAVVTSVQKKPAQVTVDDQQQGHTVDFAKEPGNKETEKTGVDIAESAAGTGSIDFSVVIDHLDRREWAAARTELLRIGRQSPDAPELQDYINTAEKELKNETFLNKAVALSNNNKMLDSRR